MFCFSLKQTKDPLLLLSQKQRKDQAFDEFCINEEDLFKNYKKSSSSFKNHGLREQLVVRDKYSNEVCVMTKIGTRKRNLIREFGALAVCNDHENVVKIREVLFFDNVYTCITEIPDRVAINLSSFLAKVVSFPELVSFDRSSVSETNSQQSTFGSRSKSKSTLSANTASSFDARLIPERFVLFIMQEILKGIKCFHDQNIVHRGITPENILIGMNGSVKISDAKHAFFLAKDKPFATQVEGKITYLPPEALATPIKYGVLADIWSFGILTLKVAENRVPHKNLAPEEQAEAIVIAKPGELQLCRHWTKHFRSMHKSCLQSNTHERASAASLLRHKCWKSASSVRNFVQFVNNFNPKLKKAEKK